MFTMMSEIDLFLKHWKIKIKIKHKLIVNFNTGKPKGMFIVRDVVNYQRA